MRLATTQDHVEQRGLMCREGSQDSVAASSSDNGRLRDSKRHRTFEVLWRWEKRDSLTIGMEVRAHRPTPRCIGSIRCGR